MPNAFLAEISNICFIYPENNLFDKRYWDL